MARKFNSPIATVFDLKISVITAVYNRAATIQDTIDSVSNQTLRDFEYVVVDGMSNDGTDELIQQNRSKIANIVRESDDGIYDALNKGILASQGDIIGFLHADDLFADEEVLQRVSVKFEEGDFDAVYADLLYVDFEQTEKIIRYWKAGRYNSARFRVGWMPPHPTVYVRKAIYEEFGMYRTDLGSAADYECLVRLMVKHQIRVGYIPHVNIRMRVGGKSNSSISNRMKANKNDSDAWKVNGLPPPLGLRFTKPLSKLPQFFRRPQDDKK